MFAHNATAAEHHGGLSSQTIDAILPEVRRAIMGVQRPQDQEDKRA
jgi:hypothetical protein